MKDLTQGPISGHLAQMSLFLGAGMLIQTLYYIVDLYFVAGIGQTALAGVSAAGTVTFLVLALTQALGVGTVTLISHAVGRKDERDAGLIFNQALVLAAFCGALLLIAGYALSDFYMEQISADTATARSGETYLHWFLPGLALQFATVAMVSALRGTGIVKPTMIVQAITLVINIVLAPILIAGWGTGRPFGVLGAGLASTIAVVAGAILLLVYFAKHEKYVRVDRTLWRPQFETWERMFNIGLPAGGELMLMFLVVGVIYWCIRDFGAAAQAGFGVGARVMQSIFLPAMAVAFAASPIAGQNFGARLADRVRETFRSAALVSTVIMAALTVICQWDPELLVGAFSSDPRVVEVGAQYLHIVSWNFIGTGIVFTCSGLFQAVGNTWPSLISSGARILTFCLPAIWLSKQPWIRLEHFWYLSVATIVVQALMSLWLLRGELRRRLVFA
ncbi:MAG TPA: MATE family efflux transporter [Steroidobacteraceae bacterium]|nr:MATE family efflux transporter [Steroidobacteraceae bacterium]